MALRVTVSSTPALRVLNPSSRSHALTETKMKQNENTHNFDVQEKLGPFHVLKDFLSRFFSRLFILVFIFAAISFFFFIFFFFSIIALPIFNLFYFLSSGVTMITTIIEP